MPRSLDYDKSVAEGKAIYTQKRRRFMAPNIAKSDMTSVDSLADKLLLLLTSVADIGNSVQNDYVDFFNIQVTTGAVRHLKLRHNLNSAVRWYLIDSAPTLSYAYPSIGRYNVAASALEDGLNVLELGIESGYTGVIAIRVEAVS